MLINILHLWRSITEHGRGWSSPPTLEWRLHGLDLQGLDRAMFEPLTPYTGAVLSALFAQLLPELNDHNLPWMDTIHPIVVHFVIAMAVIAVLFDLLGSIMRQPSLYEVSFWNLLVATAAIFVAIIFGQVEAGLAEPYGAAREILNLHSTIGWSLAGVLAALTGWRYVIRSRDPSRLPVAFLGAGGLLVALVVVQVTLGNQLIWTYGLHTVPVVEAIRAGLV